MTATAAESLIMVFAKAPVVGKVKTRLCPALGEKGAARLHRQLLHHTLNTVSRVDNVARRLYGVAFGEDGYLQEYAAQHGMAYEPQRGDDLGARMASAFADALKAYRRVIIVGTDCPGLTPTHYRRAFAALDECDAVVIPALDGGYVLLGLREFSPLLFEGIDWGTDRVMDQTRSALHVAGSRWRAMAALADIDRPEDLKYCSPELLDGVTDEMAG